jgi:hypothetical protein
MRNFCVAVLGAGALAIGLLAAPPAANATYCYSYCAKYTSIPTIQKVNGAITVTGWKTVCTYNKICVVLPVDIKTIVVPPHPDPGPLFKELPSRTTR